MTSIATNTTVHLEPRRSTRRGRSRAERRVISGLGRLLAGVVVGASLLAQPVPLAGAAMPTFSIVSSMQQVRPTQTLAATPAVSSLTAARNETESFQLVVQGPATNVSLSGDLFGWGTTGMYRMTYNEVTEPSDAEGATGRWGDALIPEVDQIYHQNRSAFPFDVPAGENRVIWVDVFVPPNVGAGQFTGALTLAANGSTAAVAVNLEVLGFTMPATSSLRNAFYLYHGASEDPICRAHTGTDNCGGSATLRRTLYSLYSRMALDNRVSLANGSGLRADQSPSNYSSSDWENLIEGPTIRGSATVPAGAGWRLAGAQSTVVSQYAYRDFHCRTACADQWEAEATEAGQDFASKFAWYGCDEPNDSAALWAACAPYASEATTAWNRPSLVTATIGQLNARAAAAGMPDTGILVPPLNRIHDKPGQALAGDQRSTYNAFLATPGRELWLYASCLSHGCGGDTFGSPNAYWDGWPGYALDAPAVQHRAMSWMARRYDASGELYYAANVKLASAFTAGGLFEAGANGDGTLFAPGKAASIGGTDDIPLETVRLKRLRDGREDFELMKWLTDHGRGADVDALVAGAFPTAYSATAAKDGTGAGTLLGARDSLLAMARAELGPANPADIVFSSDRDGNLELYSMEENGAGVVRLTNDAAVDQFPAWSPDGQTIAWTRGTDIWAMDDDGANPRNLSGSIADPVSKPAWSRDGTQLAFVRLVAGRFEIWRMNADGSGVAPVVTYAVAGANSYDPTVSATDVVFYSQAGDLYRVNLTGTGRSPVLTGSAVDEVPDLGNRGRRMAFSRSTTGATPYDVVTSRMDGTDRTNLTATAAGGPSINDLGASFSPDDSKLAFVTFVGGDAEIYTIGADGSGPVALTSNGFVDTDPDWRTLVPPVPALPCLANPPSPTHSFGDVPGGAYYSDAVSWLVASAVTSGVGPGVYAPGTTVTRAQMAAFLWRLVCTPLPAQRHAFGDVSSGAYYDQAVSWLVQAGVTGGTSPGAFSPASAVTRGQMAAFLWRLAGSPAPAAAHAFGDVSGGAYYNDAVSWLVEAQITTGVAPGTFAPNSPVSRGQMAAFLFRYAN
ncbi:MAG: S-layer homology domain-containing protein [Microthrixaceae bacterium]